MQCVSILFILVIFIALIESRKKNLHYKTTAAEDSITLSINEKRSASSKAFKNVSFLLKK